MSSCSGSPRDKRENASHLYQVSCLNDFSCADCPFVNRRSNVFWDDPEYETETCPCCDTENYPIGNLGYRAHYRCRACGMMYSRSIVSGVHHE
jgi:hypothetical protein